MLKLFQYSRHLIALFTILIILSGIGAYKLAFFYDLEDFFPEDEEQLQFMRKYQSALESDDTYIFIAIDNEKSVFDTAFLNRLKNFTHESREIEAILQSNSLATLSDYLKTPLGFSRIPILHIDDADRLMDDSAKVFNDPRWRGSFISENGNITVVFLKSVPKIPQKRAEKLVKELDVLLKKYNFNKVHIVSRAHTQVTFISLIKTEVFLFVGLSVLVLTLVLIWVYRKFWGVVIPLFSSIVGLILFLGYMYASGQPLDLMSTLFPALIITIGMSNVIHLMNKYCEELELGHTNKSAMAITLKKIGVATLLTCVTTVIGFLASAVTMSIKPIQQFSINAAAGVSIAFFTSVFFTCMLLLFFRREQLTSHKVDSHLWAKAVKKIHDISDLYPGRVMIYTGVVLIFCIWGLFKISTNTYLLSDVPRTDKLRKDFHFFEDNLAGARPFEMAVLPQKNYSISDIEVLRAVDTLTAYLDARPEFGNLASTPSVYKTMHKGFMGGSLSQYKLPEEQHEIDRYNRYLDQTKGDLLHSLINREENLGRISGRVKDYGSDSIKLINQQIDNWINKNIDTSILKFKHTGIALLIDLNNDLLTVSLFQGLLLAFLVIAIIMAFLFRDIKMVFISLVPNMLPLIVCGAIMGWAHIELKASTAIIFAVVFGIAVDDTIHFLSYYRLQLSYGKHPHEAVLITFEDTGKAIIVTSVLLFAGFIIMAFSTFTATYYMGMLMSFTFLSALLSNLFVLPVLLRWAYKQEPQQEELL